MRVLVAPDKFKGTASAGDIAAAVVAALEEVGHEAIAIPMADGGEGTLEALGGANRTTSVTGPGGEPVEAAWRLSKGLAVIEMAEASGLSLAGGPEVNDPVDATTRGTGELIMAAITRGAKRIIVGLGGSATTDGGLGAVEAIGSPARLLGVELEVATDVTTTFIDAAEVFGPQKGATPAQVAFLKTRLRGLAEQYRDRYGVDVESAPGSGAAGGLGGGLMAFGGRIVSGFDLIADELRLFETLQTVDLIITGEGRLDQESFNGKVVGGVVELAAEVNKPVLAIAGMVEPELWARSGLPRDVTAVSLSEQFGADESNANPAALAARVAGQLDTFL